MVAQAYCYADATELRNNTVIPKWAQGQLHSVSGLEAATGADWMVSGLSRLPRTIRNPLTGAARRALDKHMRAHYYDGDGYGNGVLIQRKSGGDLIGSIANLNNIQRRMMEWARPGGCRLLITDVRPTKDGKVTAGGRKYNRTFKSITDKLWWWEWRGGHIDWLDSDDEINDYIRQVQAAVAHTMEEPIRYTAALDSFVSRGAMQTLTESELDWVLTGSAFPPGWGTKLRTAAYDSLVQDRYTPSLANAIERICAGKIKIPGIGPKRIQTMREWVGYEDSDEWRTMRNLCSLVGKDVK